MNTAKKRCSKKMSFSPQFINVYLKKKKRNWCRLARIKDKVARCSSGRAWLRAGFASALENIASLSKKWRYTEKGKGEKRRVCTRGCMWIERSGRVRRLATPLASPLWAMWRGGRYRDWPATGSRGRTSINYSK